ncbi:MAG: mechanosensitive ion channel family protein [Muribaculaceae bacterium]|nr:mechanosensitive ion channel family protein [Muribaculaceae bacterium]MDE6523487.1 mechanosensitive ion channel family protein [Muribaculaceae bacterium]
MNAHTFLCLIPTEVAEKLPKVTMLGTEDGTYAIARLIMNIVDWIFNLFGLSHHPTLELWVYSILVFAISWGIGYITQLVVLFIVNQVGKRWSNPIYSDLRNAGFFHKISRIIPALYFLIFIQFTMQSHSALSSWLSRFTWIFLSFIVARCLTIITYIIWNHVDKRENKKHLPLKGLVQLICGLIWILFAIVAVSIILDKSPGTLLAGLGVFASVLMLIFKDSILGLVAGVQLSENDSVHVGDWIAVDGTNANGTVLEVSLTEVKIQNWDKTVTSVPPYNLISGSFTTYLPMQESNTRRIARTYLIDCESVVEATPDLIAKIAEIPLMKEWIEKKQAQKAAGKEYCVNNPEGLADGTIDTNLGMFRAYMKMWLMNNPNISNVDDLFVNTLQQTQHGIPFQVYCFTSTSAWIPYEGIQSAVFEHVAVMLTKFNLFVFENESSRATILEGVMSRQLPAGESVFGLPTPMIIDNPKS